MYADHSLQHGTEGIEIKASRYSSGWQGHNPEEGWLMVIVFESNRPTDRAKKVPAIPFRFKSVYSGDSHWPIGVPAGPGNNLYHHGQCHEIGLQENDRKLDLPPCGVKLPWKVFQEAANGSARNVKKEVVRAC